MRIRDAHGLAGVALMILVAESAALAAPADEHWICQGVDGTVVSAHGAEQDARASCQQRAQAAAGGIFIVVPAGGTAAPVPGAPPVVARALVCSVPGACPADTPPSGRRGSWSWVPPTRLENGNIRTDLAHFAMYRQVAGGQPEQFAEISAQVTNLFWGMDTRDANACFWIEAVRLHSAPMPSDRSNRICMDADGQLLPKA